MSQKTQECVPIECIYNDRLKRGLCVGVSNNTRSYSRDVIRMCWVNQKPNPRKLPCHTNTQAQMTPNEAIAVGVALIQGSIIGQTLLKRLEASKKATESKPERKEGKKHEG